MWFLRRACDYYRKVRVVTESFWLLNEGAELLHEACYRKVMVATGCFWLLHEGYGCYVKLFAPVHRKLQDATRNGEVAIQEMF